MKNRAKIKTENRIILAIVTVITFIVFFTNYSSAQAQSPTYITTTFNGAQAVISPPIFTPSRSFKVADAVVEDMTVKDGTVYVVDSLSKRVRVFDKSGTELWYYEGLTSPQGIFLAEHLYVADKSGEVAVFDLKQRQPFRRIKKPTSPLFNNATFIPIKVVVDKFNNIFVVSEGNGGGVIQLNSHGEFEGYVGANKTKSSVSSFFKNLFLSKNQLNKTPTSPSGVAIDGRGILYTITPLDAVGAIKRLNTAGGVTLSTASNESVVAITLDEQNNVYAVADGGVSVFNASLKKMFSFTSSQTADRFGRIVKPVAIGVEGNELFVLDKDSGEVTVFLATQYFRDCLVAVNLYENGLNEQAEEQFRELIKINPSFTLAYKSLASAHMKRGDYATAKQLYKRADDKSGYAKAWWMQRNSFLTQYGAIIFVTAVSLIVAVTFLIKALNKKTANNKFVNQLKYSFKYIIKPFSAVEGAVNESKVSVFSATVIFALFVLIGILSNFYTGYVFSNGVKSVAQTIITFTVPFILAVISNYAVSTVVGGAGTLKQVYIASAYTLTPYVIIKPFYIILTHIVSANETAILTFLQVIMIALTIVIALTSIYKVHYFSVKSVAKNVILSLVCGTFTVVAIALGYLLVSHQLSFYKQLAFELF